MFDVDNEAVLAMLRTLHQAGQPCPVILLLGPNETPLADIRAATPSTPIIFRYYRADGDQPHMSVTEWIRRYIDPSPDRKRAKWIQINNEWNVFSAAEVAWWKDRMIEAESLGYRLAVLNYGVGNPALPEDRPKDGWDFWTRPDVHDLLRHIRDKEHILNLHQYDRGNVVNCTWTGDYDIQRFERKVMPLLPADLQANPPLVVHTEFGQQACRDLPESTLLAKMRNAQEWDVQYPWLLGGCVWALGDTKSVDWLGDNWGNKIGVLTRLYLGV